MTDFERYDNYIFDIDGTVLHTAPRILECIKNALDFVGATYDETKICMSLIGPKITEIIDSVSPDLTTDAKDDIVRHFRKNYDDDPVSKTEIYPQMSTLLRHLKKEKKKLFVATNKPYKPTMLLLKAFGLNDFIDIYCPDKYAGKKLSKTEMIAEIIKNNALASEQTIMVGDTNGDFLAAKENNVAFAFADWGYAANKEALALKADIILSEENYD